MGGNVFGDAWQLGFVALVQPDGWSASRQSERADRQNGDESSHGRLTPELSRAALRPWASENYQSLHEAAKRARLERIVRAHHQICTHGQFQEI